MAANPKWQEILIVITPRRIITRHCVTCLSLKGIKAHGPLKKGECFSCVEVLRFYGGLVVKNVVLLVNKI